MSRESQSQSHKLLTNYLLLSSTHRSISPQDTNPPPPPYSLFRPTVNTNTSLSLPTHLDEVDESEDDEESHLSPLKIHISNPIHVNGTSNLVLPPPPEVTAKSIAKAVVKAMITQMNEAESGASIPMIDENGCLRAVEVRIEAGIKVEGRGNVVGGETGVEGLRRVVAGLRGRRDAAAAAVAAAAGAEVKKEMEGRDVGRDVGKEQGQGRKRRASSAPAGEREGKRERERVA